MKRSILILAASMIAIGCGNAAKPIESNTTAAASTPERSETAIAHGPKEQMPADNSNGQKTKWSQGGDPMDTTALDADIAKAEKALSAKPSDPAAKKELGTAYYKRAVALTDKRQYASALGDYRRSFKYDPSNTEAKDWIDKIIMIYDSMNKASPPEGEEPPPLPFKKGT